MASDESYTITTTYVGGGTSTLSGVRNHSSAVFIQEERMADDHVVRCEIRNNVTGLVQGRSKPEPDDADMLRAELDDCLDDLAQCKRHIERLENERDAYRAFSLKHYADAERMRDWMKQQPARCSANGVHVNYWWLYQADHMEEQE